jgi:hypothetical protein
MYSKHQRCYFPQTLLSGSTLLSKRCYDPHFLVVFIAWFRRFHICRTLGCHLTRRIMGWILVKSWTHHLSRTQFLEPLEVGECLLMAGDQFLHSTTIVETATRGTKHSGDFHPNGHQLGQKSLVRGWCPSLLPLVTVSTHVHFPLPEMNCVLFNLSKIGSNSKLELTVN